MNHPNKVALFWLATAIGVVLSATLHLFFYVNEFVRVRGATPALTFDTGTLWVVSAFYGLWIATVLLALIGTRRTDWITLVAGSLLVALSTLGGIADGLRDGWHVTFAAILFITLPGAFAVAVTWRHIAGKGVTHVHE
ncbi:hypothetical protein [Xanthomonas medicagonis]|uniref:hypothetical protein n=1 Tax=Xanthomonas medicagonis TaxID=3160841 RepID=UPI0035137450